MAASNEVFKAQVSYEEAMESGKADLALVSQRTFQYRIDQGKKDKAGLNAATVLLLQTGKEPIVISALTAGAGMMANQHSERQALQKAIVKAHTQGWAGFEGVSAGYSLALDSRTELEKRLKNVGVIVYTERDCCNPAGCKEFLGKILTNPTKHKVYHSVPYGNKTEMEKALSAELEAVEQTYDTIKIEGRLVNEQALLQTEDKDKKEKTEVAKNKLPPVSSKQVKPKSKMPPTSSLPSSSQSLSQDEADSGAEQDNEGQSDDPDNEAELQEVLKRSLMSPEQERKEQFDESDNEEELQEALRISKQSSLTPSSSSSSSSSKASSSTPSSSSSSSSSKASSSSTSDPITSSSPSKDPSSKEGRGKKKPKKASLPAPTQASPASVSQTSTSTSSSTKKPMLTGYGAFRDKVRKHNQKLDQLTSKESGRQKKKKKKITPKGQGESDEESDDD